MGTFVVIMPTTRLKSCKEVFGRALDETKATN